VSKPEWFSVVEALTPDTLTNKAQCRSPAKFSITGEVTRFYPGLHFDWYALCEPSNRTPDSGLIIDYVFDGKAPPYIPTAVTNPLQGYGKSKRDGEVEVLKAGEEGASVVVLRVPVL
jgi:RmlD substrate binding domain